MKTIPERLTPDELLAQIHNSEEREKRGKLKLFLGMSPGVGKTYAMLQEAHERLREGINVLVGYVETHGRAETEALVRGLEVLPRKALSYRGAVLEEFDSDAVLARKPELVLVDELAHTNATDDNAPTRHAKRWQDVLELLDAGIDVYSTLNVQHLESRADTVRAITGITVRETVPDSIVERADEIELVDISPDELLDRLQEGKVYTPEKSQQAVQNFFRKGNLTALREMALRLTAERVEGQLNEYRTENRIASPWKSGDRLLVAVSASPYSEQLVRWTRRMAYTMKAPWIALSVETARPLSAEDSQRLAKNIALARELGAEIQSIADDDIVRGILRSARQHNISQIVVGKPHHQARASIVERLIEESGTIDLHVVRMETLWETHIGAAKRLSRWDKAREFVKDLFSDGTTRWRNYALASALALALALGCLPLYSLMSYQAIGFIMLFGVALSALALQGSAVALMAALSAMLWNYLFIPPRFTFVIGSVEDRLMFLLYFVIALALGILTSRIRLRERSVRHREERTAALYDVARELSTARSIDDVVSISIKHINALFDADTTIILSEHTTQKPHERLQEQAHEASSYQPNVKERSIAEWAFTNRRAAGRFTSTLPSAGAHYAPLLAPRGAVGVLGLAVRGETIRADWQGLLDNLIGQIAAALEREELNAEAKQSRVIAESERLYGTLLNSISHEFRTPLAVINGSSEALALAEPPLPTVHADYAHEIQTASRRLNYLVENLLDMTRLEAGHLQLRKAWCNLADTLNSALERTRSELMHHEVALNADSDVMLCFCDAVLIEQVVVNILLNAARYTPAGTQVQCGLRETDAGFILTIADTGAGVPPDALALLFDKFYRADTAKAGGTGLGLSICKGFVEAHGGTITAENRPGGGLQMSGGLQITIVLPRGAERPNDER
jgi:two-component system sensor histidine kinase KdpD